MKELSEIDWYYSPLHGTHIVSRSETGLTIRGIDEKYIRVSKRDNLLNYIPLNLISFYELPRN